MSARGFFFSGEAVGEGEWACGVEAGETASDASAAVR